MTSPSPDDEVQRLRKRVSELEANRKEMELLLRNTEQSFSAAFAEAPIGMVLLSPEGTLLEVNRAYWQMLGYGSEHLTGRNSARITFPEDVEKTRQFFEILRRAETDKAVLEKRYIHKDGRTIWTRASATMRRDAQGRPMQVVAIVEDITHDKLSEKVLRESEERLQLIFAQAPVGVCVMRGRELVYELVNPHYQELLPNRDLLGHPLLEVVPEVSPAVLDILYGVLDTGKPFAATEFLIPLDQNRDGIIEDCWFNFVYHPLMDRNESVTGVVAIALDVSSHVRARAELQRANRELEEFAYVSSHDLHEPLRMVNIYTQLLMDDLKPLLTNTTIGYAEQVQRGVHRMERLLKDLLNFSRVVASESAPDSPETMADLNLSVREAVQTMQGRIDEQGASLSIGKLPIIYGDQAQLAQVFQNLISNALKYRNSARAAIIEITGSSEGPEAIVVIRDNGIGFDQNQSERIFGLFKRLYKDEYPGTGLGLAICKRIVERYGGRIWAESSPDQGAAFFLAFKKAAASD
jgi:PAS domain S-box-containing protein